MLPGTLRIGLATPRVAATREEGLATVERFLAEAATQGVAIVCFPETYLPGYRGLDFSPPPIDQAAQERALQAVCEMAREHRIAVIMPMEWSSLAGRAPGAFLEPTPDVATGETAGLLNLAFVINADGTIQGSQTKNQIAPEEEATYVHGDTRHLFVISGVPFGIVICHEGWRYPETVRWAARRGARVVFHPHLAGSDLSGTTRQHWGEPVAPYFENAMIARAAENVIYFASVNYTLRYPETATSLITPDGTCAAHAAYGEETLLIVDLDPAMATGLFAQRYAPARYPE